MLVIFEIIKELNIIPINTHTKATNLSFNVLHDILNYVTPEKI